MAKKQESYVQIYKTALISNKKFKNYFHKITFIVSCQLHKMVNSYFTSLAGNYSNL